MENRASFTVVSICVAFFQALLATQTGVLVYISLCANIEQFLVVVQTWQTINVSVLYAVLNMIYVDSFFWEIILSCVKETMTKEKLNGKLLLCTNKATEMRRMMLRRSNNYAPYLVFSPKITFLFCSYDF